MYKMFESLQHKKKKNFYLTVVGFYSAVAPKSFFCFAKMSIFEFVHYIWNTQM